MRIGTTLGAAALAAAGLASPALANPPDQERESKVIRRVLKDFGKLRGYRVDFSAEGGVAQGADHRLVDRTVAESYRADVLGRIARIQSPAAFRSRTDANEGAVEGNGRWMAMLATDDGRLLARLFEAPEKVLAEVNRFKRHAEWVPPEEDGAPSERLTFTSRSDDDEDDARGGTRERDDDRDSSGRDEDGPISHHLRVPGPVEVALDRFITITNSGCFSEG